MLSFGDRVEPSPDTELMLLAALLEVNRVELEAITLAHPLEQRDLAARLRVLLEARDDMAGRLARMRATTVAGRLAKASALLAPRPSTTKVMRAHDPG
jgi:hypothetical protein